MRVAQPQLLLIGVFVRTIFCPGLITTEYLYEPFFFVAIISWSCQALSFLPCGCYQFLKIALLYVTVAVVLLVVVGDVSVGVGRSYHLSSLRGGGICANPALAPAIPHNTHNDLNFERLFHLTSRHSILVLESLRSPTYSVLLQ